MCQLNLCVIFIFNLLLTRDGGILREEVAIWIFWPGTTTFCTNLKHHQNLSKYDWMFGVTGIVWRYVCSAGMSQHGPTPNNVTENTVAQVYVEQLEHWRQARGFGSDKSWRQESTVF